MVFLLKNVKSKMLQIPPELRTFFLKASILYVGWFLFYDCYLHPNGLLDPLLTQLVGASTISVLKLIYFNHVVSQILPAGSPIITIDGKIIISILDGCNALELIILYIGFIVCMPSKVKTMLKFIVLGAVGIYAINVLRCVLLAFVTRSFATYFDLVHHYVFVVIVYSFIFFLWVIYLKNAYSYKGQEV